MFICLINGALAKLQKIFTLPIFESEFHSLMIKRQIVLMMIIPKIEDV